MDAMHTEHFLKSLVQEYPDRTCKVYMLHGDLTPGQMTGLYNHPKIKALINIAHGEGFGLPMFEAAREALPVVAVGWSGHMDFLTNGTDEYFQKVDYTLGPIPPEAVWDGVLQSDSMWAYAVEDSYKKTLRNTMDNWTDCKKTAETLKGFITTNFSEEKLFEQFCKSIYSPTEEELEWLDQLSDIEIL